MVDSRLKSKIPRTINTAMKKRGACILKKARELSILCDIRVCALIADPNNGNFHTWPEDRTQVINLLKQFKNVENNKKKKENSCDVNAITNNGQTEKKMKNLDFSCFDDKSINQLSRDSLEEISKLLNSKVEAARERVEFLKKNMTVTDKGFQHLNATLNFDTNMFNPLETMLDFPQFPSILPSSNGIPDYYFGAIDLGNNGSFNVEPEYVLHFPPSLSSYSPSVDNDCSSIGDPEIILDYPPPPLSYSGVDNGCSSNNVSNMLDYPQTVFYLGADYGCSSTRVPADCDFGSENAYSGSSYTESNTPFDLPPPLSFSPSVDRDHSTIRVPDIILDYPPPLSYSGVYNGRSSNSVPEYMLDYPQTVFYSGVNYGCSSTRVPDDCYFGTENAYSGSTYTESNTPFDFPPTLSCSSSVDTDCSTYRVPEIILDYPPPLSYSGAEYYSCSNSDCYFGSENASGGRTFIESASPFEEVTWTGFLEYSPIELEEDMLYGGASMATIPLQPLQLIDYSFY